MMLKTTNEIDIVRVKNSKINEVDFENLAFGNTFTDHMLICDFKEGKWQKPIIKPYEPFLIDPSAKVFHYGQAIFEGMKAYKDDNNDVWLFRPDQNLDRFNKSAVRMAMPEVPEEIFIGGLKTIVDLERNWVKKGIIAEHYSRAANGGIGAAKAAGNYSAQFYPQKLAQEKGFQQIIWTDDATHTKLEEAGTMNVFFRINDTIYTAPTSERILDGVTRKSLIDIAHRDGIKVEERSVLVSELIAGAKDGSLKEIFGAGTAAVVSPIVGFQFQNDYYELPKIENSIALQLKDKLTKIQYKLAEDTFGWTVKV